MKIRLILFSVLASSALTAFSQGTVNYNNVISGLRAPILIAPAHSRDQVQGQPIAPVANSTPNGNADYGAGAIGAAGTGFTAQLWAAPDAGTPLTAVPGSAQPLRTGAFAGYFTAVSTLAVPQVPLNGSGTFQLRAWDNLNGTVTTWAQVMGNDAILRGQGLSFVNATGGGGTPATLPASLTGLTAFNLFSPVPEPSLIALGALGLGAFLLRRRKA